MCFGQTWRRMQIARRSSEFAAPSTRAEMTAPSRALAGRRRTSLCLCLWRKRTTWNRECRMRYSRTSARPSRDARLTRHRRTPVHRAEEESKLRISTTSPTSLAYPLRRHPQPPRLPPRMAHSYSIRWDAPCVIRPRSRPEHPGTQGCQTLPTILIPILRSITWDGGWRIGSRKEQRARINSALHLCGAWDNGSFSCTTVARLT